MRKIRNLIVMLALISLLAVSVSGAVGKATLTPDAVTAGQGEVFSVTVELADAGEINIGTVLLIYDSNIFEMTGGTCLVDDTAFAQVVPEKNAGTFLLTGAKAVSGEIFTFHFQVKDSAALGEYEITMKTSVGNGKGEYIETTGAKVTVTDAPSGNASSDNASVVTDTEPAKSFPWWLVIAAVLIAAAVVVILLRKKNK